MSRRVVVVGAGVNELVAAHYLARAGHAVTLVCDRAAPEQDVLETGWTPPKIARDLELERHGLTIASADPWAMVLPEEGGLELSRSVERSAQAIAKSSARDAAKWPEFCKRMHAHARLLESLYAAPPPDPMGTSPRELARLGRLGLRVRSLGRQGLHDLLRLLPMSVADFLDEWFESDLLKGVLGAAGVMNLSQGPRSGGTAFNLLHHHVGSPAGVFRPPVSNMRAALRRRPGVQRRSGTVARIEVREGRARSVVLHDGEELAADAVVSGLTPAKTLLELIDPGWLDPQLVRAVRNIRSRGVAARVSLTLDRDPRFTTLVIAPSLDYLERAYDSVKHGRVSSQPYIEARHAGASAADRCHVEVHVQYVPHLLRNTVWDTAESEKLGRAVVSRLSEQVPGLERWVIGQQVLTPDDLEHIDGFPQGQPYHAELALDQVLWMRPAPQLAQYRTPIAGLYLCGPAMHPGGGVAGAAGANAASVILGELKKRKK